MINKTEKEIMQNWEGEINKPLVSICCITYNHEKYITETIDNFLMQETKFSFEVLINDDCSTDKTQEIILKYVKKYPNIIKTIFQKENQYSKGKRMMPFLFEIAKGSYLALCEGDDYWTDKKKLQIQIDEMKKYPEINMSFHAASELIEGKIGKTLSKYSNKNKIFTTSEVILGEGDFCPTASLMFKKEVLLNLPQWFYDEAPVGDYYLQIFGSVGNGALYIDKVMAIYRKGHAGSWTTTGFDNSGLASELYITNREKHIFSMINTLMKFNDYLKNNNDDEFIQIISRYYFKLSKLYLKFGLFEKFSTSIENGCKNYKQTISICFILYFFRGFPRILRYIYKFILLTNSMTKKVF